MVKTAVSVAVAALLMAAAGCSPGSPDAGPPADPTVSPRQSETAPPATAPTETAGPETSAPADPPSQSPAAEPVVLTIKDFVFEAPTVAPGAEITVENTDRSTHSVTSEDDSFAEGIVEGGGATGTVTAPTAPGRYKYVCKFHPEMVATLVVKISR